MIARICKSFVFHASHSLPLHPGKCANLHGHTYTMEIELSGEVSEEDGMVVDFEAVKEAAGSILKEWDHKHLNDQIVGPPTAENLAIEAFKWMSFLNNEANEVLVERVRIWETPTCWAEVRREDNE